MSVSDQTGLAGHTVAATSPNPFYIVRANPDSVRTLILENTARMQARAGVTPEQAAALDRKLQELAAHPRVLGLVVDLAGATGLGSLYADWDADPGSAEKANAVLFGCHGSVACAVRRSVTVSTTWCDRCCGPTRG